MNTTTRELGNAKSGVPVSCLEWTFQPLKPFRISNERKRHSVERFPLDRIARMLAERELVGLANDGRELFTQSTVKLVRGTKGSARSLNPRGTKGNGFLESIRSSM